MGQTHARVAILTLGLALGLCAGPTPRAEAGPRIQPVSSRAVPAIPLVHLKTGKRYTLELFDASGQMRHAALTELREFLKCTRTGIDHPIHWRLMSILAAVAARWPGKRIYVVSGYRHPKASRHAKRSNHTRGRALDFRVEGVPNRQLRDMLRESFTGVGVGYYPNSTFIHLDIREHDGRWIDYAGPGQDACYSPDVVGDLASGVAESLSYEQAIARGCKGKQPRVPRARSQKGTKTAAKGAAKAPDDEHAGTRPGAD